MGKKTPYTKPTFETRYSGYLNEAGARRAIRRLERAKKANRIHKRMISNARLAQEFLRDVRVAKLRANSPEPAS